MSLAKPFQFRALVAPFVFLPLLAGPSGCSERDAPDEALPRANPKQLEALRRSRQVWEDAKRIAKKPYSYSVVEEGGALGLGKEASVTVITVRDGKVVARGWSNMATTLSKLTHWSESSPAMVGKNAQGAPPRTLEELYEECENDILPADPVVFEVSLHMNEDGLLERCTKRERRSKKALPVGPKVAHVKFETSRCALLPMRPCTEPMYVTKVTDRVTGSRITPDSVRLEFGKETRTDEGIEGVGIYSGPGMYFPKAHDGHPGLRFRVVVEKEGFERWEGVGKLTLGDAGSRLDLEGAVELTPKLAR